jgi:uncharacterized PurR-regulated membrane protein YhhQ (DUF165 family)
LKAPTLRPLLGFLALTLTAQAACLLLLRLSQFGQNPFPELPLVVVAMVGALFSAPLYHLARRLDPNLLPPALLAAVGLNLMLSAVLTGTSSASPYFLLAPATGIALALLLRAIPRGPMVAAMTVYVVCTLLANYTFDSFLPLGDFFLVNVGTFFFGITFTQRDRVHQYGRRSVYLMILLAAAANVALALTLGTPLRYVAVGFLAIVLSETADTEIYQRLLNRRWLTRVASSNAVSAPLDTLIFTVLAFAGEPFATTLWMVQVIATDVVVKFAASMVAALRLVVEPRAGARNVPARLR